MQCQVCGERTWNQYCSNACKQKAYRQRKKQQKLAEKETVHMDVFATADALIADFPEDMRDGFSSLLWKNIDMLDLPEQQLSILAMCRFVAKWSLKNRSEAKA